MSCQEDPVEHSSERQLIPAAQGVGELNKTGKCRVSSQRCHEGLKEDGVSGSLYWRGYNPVNYFRGTDSQAASSALCYIHVNIRRETMAIPVPI